MYIDAWHVNHVTLWYIPSIVASRYIQNGASAIKAPSVKIWNNMYQINQNTSVKCACCERFRPSKRASTSHHVRAAPPEELLGPSSWLSRFPSLNSEVPYPRAQDIPPIPPIPPSQTPPSKMWWGRTALSVPCYGTVISVMSVSLGSPDQHPSRTNKCSLSLEPTSGHASTSWLLVPSGWRNLPLMMIVDSWHARATGCRNMRNGERPLAAEPRSG